MKICWSWLKDYVDLDVSVDALIERFTAAGLNHESTSEAAGEVAVEFEVTSNRPDCLSHIGLAREAAVLFGRELRIPPTDSPESDVPVERLVQVEVDETAGWCPQYRARVIEGATIGPSPEWLVRRLASIGIGAVNNVVDATNYVMMECGQPLHAFDLDAIRERRIVVRSACAGEKFLAINNRTYELREGMGVIADASTPAAVAGIMGGKHSEVGRSTRNILLEAAEFSPLSVRRTSRELDLSSDSSYRFERKIDPLGVAWASDRACQLICELAGGRLARGAFHHRAATPAAPRIRLRYERVGRILGIDVPRAECRRILESLGLTIVEEDANGLTAAPPSFRRDLTREVDLIEEVGRIHGYAEVPQNRVLPLRATAPGKDRRAWSRIRDVLIASGFCEAVTFSFTDAEAASRVRPWTSAEPILLQHSSRKQENRLRQSLLPSLLESVRLNESRGREGVRLFETATLFWPEDGAGLPKEPRALGLVAAADVRVLRGVVEAILERLKIAFVFQPTDVVGFAAGQAAEYRLAGERVAVLGVVDPAVRDRLDLRAAVAAAEILLGPLVERAQLEATVQPIPKLPPVVRDLAVVVDEGVRWAQIEQCVRSSCGPFMAELEFIDLYRGKQVDAGKKSIAFRMTFRASDRTLTKDEVDQFVQNVVEELSKSVQGELRA
jgi:phenylalanyl-tRNA synthetase beta chain